MIRQKIILMIVATIVVLLVLIVLGSTILIQKPSVPVPTPSPTTTKLHPFLMIEVGRSIPSDLTSRPNFKNKISLDKDTLQYSFNSLIQDRANLIITRDDKAIFERAITLEGDSKHPQLSDYKQRLGEPDAELEGSKFYGQFEKTYVYASKGFALVGNPFTGEIDEIQTFIPTTTEGYLSQWGEDIVSGQQLKEELGK